MSSERHRAEDCLADIIDNIERIAYYLAGLNRDDLANDGLRRDAVERCLERMCEAAFRLGDRAEVLIPGQSWRAIRGLGNRLRHAYDRVDFTVIWGVITERLPQLRADATAALARLRSEGCD